MSQELAAFSGKMTQQRAARETVLQEQRAKAGTLGAANRALLVQQFGPTPEAASPTEGQQQQQQQQQQPHHKQGHQGKLAAEGQGSSTTFLQGGGDGHSVSCAGERLQEEGRGGEAGEGWEGEVQGEETEAPHGGEGGATSRGAEGSIARGGDQGGGSGGHLGVAEAIQQLCSAAMVLDAQAMLNCMLPRHEAHVSLQASRAAAQAEVGFLCFVVLFVCVCV